MIETLENRFKDEPDDMPKYCHINNWINEKEIIPLSKDNERVLKFKKDNGLDDKYVIMYSGNIGLYYDLENIIKIIAKFKDNKDVVFAFIGEGSLSG